MTHVSLLAALSDPSRQAILSHLREKALPVVKIANQMEISRPAVSQHLKVLHSAGLVGVQKHGTRHFYHLTPGGFEELRRFAESYWLSAMKQFKVFTE